MKNIESLLIACLSFFLMNVCLAQTSGVISYQETMKLDIQLDDVPAGIDLAGMLPSSRSISRKLIFDGNESVYIDGDDVAEDTELSSDDGSIQIKIMESDIENKIYTDHKNNIRLEQQGFMGKAFLINMPVEKLKWKITPEKIKYLDYECMKATMTDEEGVEIVAWFAPAIPVKAGPAEYGQLPGAILMLSKGDKELEIKAIKVEMGEVDEIKKPDDGKKVTEEEYEKIVEEKMKEVESEHGGRRIMIRG